MKANVLKRVLLAKATVFVGLAMIAAVVLGAASTAFAANGQPWILGQSNVATMITQLGGASGVNGPMVQLTNNNADANDTALSLNVQPGEAPMRVNSSAKVGKLNADQVDDLDSVMSGRTYPIAPDPSTGGALANQKARFEAHCDVGDVPVGGGIANVEDRGTAILDSFPEMRFEPPQGDGWVVTIQNDSTTDDVSAVVLCSDNPPFH